MDDWDWEDIDVLAGEWWLCVIAILVALVGLTIGYLVGVRRERRSWQDPALDEEGRVP